MNDRSAPLLDRSRLDDHDHPTASRQGNSIPRPGSSGSNPDYRRISHFRGGLRSDWPSPPSRLDSGAQHPPTGSFLGSSSLLGLGTHHGGHHQELLSNFARHRASTLARPASTGGPSMARRLDRLDTPYSAATPPLPAASLAGAAGGGGGGGDDSWLDFLAMPSTSMSLSLLADHPTALGGSHTSAGGAYDFPFGLAFGGTGRSSGGGSGGLGIGSYGLPEGTGLDKERELLAREGGNDFGPRKRPRWE